MSEKFDRYKEYLKSESWHILKQEKFCQVGKACQACEGFGFIHVHHIRYKNLIDCTVDDLAVLCEQCHNALHRVSKRKGFDLDGLELEQIKVILDAYRKTYDFAKRQGRIKPSRKHNKPKVPHLSKAGKSIIRRGFSAVKQAKWTVESAVKFSTELNEYLKRIYPVEMNRSLYHSIPLPGQVLPKTQ